jgi:hypothetical protein
MVVLVMLQLEPKATVFGRETFHHSKGNMATYQYLKREKDARRLALRGSDKTKPRCRDEGLGEGWGLRARVSAGLILWGPGREEDRV